MPVPAKCGHEEVIDVEHENAPIPASSRAVGVYANLDENGVDMGPVDTQLLGDTLPAMPEAWVCAHAAQESLGDQNSQTIYYAPA